MQRATTRSGGPPGRHPARRPGLPQARARRHPPPHRPAPGSAMPRNGSSAGGEALAPAVVDGAAGNARAPHLCQARPLALHRPPRADRDHRPRLPARPPAARLLAGPPAGAAAALQPRPAGRCRERLRSPRHRPDRDRCRRRGRSALRRPPARRAAGARRPKPCRCARPARSTTSSGSAIGSTSASVDYGDGGAWLDERLAAFERGATFPCASAAGKGDKEIDARPLVTRVARVAPEHRRARPALHRRRIGEADRPARRDPRPRSRRGAQPAARTRRTPSTAPVTRRRAAGARRAPAAPSAGRVAVDRAVRRAAPDHHQLDAAGGARRHDGERAPARDPDRARARAQHGRQHLQGPRAARAAGHAGGVRRHRPGEGGVPARRRLLPAQRRRVRARASAPSRRRTAAHRRPRRGSAGAPGAAGAAPARAAADRGAPAEGPGHHRPDQQGADRHQGRARHLEHLAARPLPGLPAAQPSGRRLAPHRQRGGAPAAARSGRSGGAGRAAASSSAPPARACRSARSSPTCACCASCGRGSSRKARGAAGAGDAAPGARRHPAHDARPVGAAT